MPKLLLTGFDAFAHYSRNPSWEAIEALPEAMGAFNIAKLKLPNIYGLAGKMLLEKAREVQPDVILMTGMDSGSAKLHIDTVAINLRDALVEDNLGRKPWNEPVVNGGPAAYFATIPVHELVQRLRRRQLPVHIGYAVGAYVCNDVFYTVAHYFQGSEVQVGFLHVPILPEMVWDDSLAQPLEATISLLEQVILQLSELYSER